MRSAPVSEDTEAIMKKFININMKITKKSFPLNKYYCSNYI